MATTKEGSSFWPGQVPFVTSGDESEQKWVKDQLQDLNLKINRQLFVERTDQADYIRFKPSSSLSHSDIGKKGGEQVVTYPESNLPGKPATFKLSVFQHETLHSLGFGHEEYHPEAPIGEYLKQAKTFRAELFEKEREPYQKAGPYNHGSVMQYNPETRFAGAPGAFQNYQDALKKLGFSKEFIEGALLNPEDLNAIKAFVGKEVPEFGKAQPGDWCIGKIIDVDGNSALQQVGNKVYLHENVQNLAVGSDRSIRYGDKGEATVSGPPKFHEPQQGGWYKGKIIRVHENSVLQQVGDKVYEHKNVQQGLVTNGTNLEVGSNLSIRYGIGMETKVSAPSHKGPSRPRGVGL